MKKRWVIWLSIGLIASAMVLIPFAFWGNALDAWTRSKLSSPGGTIAAAAMVVALLAADVILPVPSSIISTFAGAYLGASLGAAASWLGMTGGSMLGYYLGTRALRAAHVRWSAPEGLGEFERDVARFGLAAVAFGRAVPVIAEASSLIAGLARLPFRRFVLVSAIANFGVSGVYALIGAYSASRGSFIGAFLGAMVLPAILWLVQRRWPRKAAT